MFLHSECERFYTTIERQYSDIICVILHHLSILTHAYKPLVDSFLQSIPSGGPAFDIKNGTLLAPILIPRGPGTAGHSSVQHHFANFFSTHLSRWTQDWQNSSITTQDGTQMPIANLIFRREPPWTKPGQANYLTLAAHYDSKEEPGFVGATDGAVPCALLMHVARSIDGFLTQMHDEMAALGEGGTVEMDMGVQIVFLDGKEDFDVEEPALYGSRALSQAWEQQSNPAGSKYPNALSQVSMFVLLNRLGSLNPAVPSYLLSTQWAHRSLGAIEQRMRGLDVLESRPPTSFIVMDEQTEQGELSDYVPFMDRGVPFLNIQPKASPSSLHKQDDDVEHLDMPTVRDWAKTLTGFALEWLDMMEVWPE